MVFPKALPLLAISSALLLADAKADQAQSQANIGNYYLSVGQLKEAKANCDAALQSNPANDSAKTCLHTLASLAIDQDLNTAEAKASQFDYSGASQLALKWKSNPALTARQQNRVEAILNRAQPFQWLAAIDGLLPEWLREVLLVMVLFAAIGLLLVFLRKLWRMWRRARWHGLSFTRNAPLSQPHSAVTGKLPFGKKMQWNLIPLKELTDKPTGIPTTHFLDALSRLPVLLDRPMWKPRLLLLRPTPPEDHDPAIIETFTPEPPEMPLLPLPHFARLEFEEHEVQLDEAAQALQLKINAGIDLGSVAKFMATIVRWFNSGSPVISGVVDKKADGSVMIQIAATGGDTQCVSVMANTASAPGLDATQLAARRAALKLILRTNHPEWTDSEVEGFAALRQAVIVFSQYAGTAKGGGDSAHTRASSLKQAACDFALFRASIPFHCMLPDAAKTSRSKKEALKLLQPIVEDPIRQADLLAEGVAHALIGTQQDLNAAITCFRQLQDWPGSEETVRYRQQAAYNEAVVWRQMGAYGRAVLMLTELLGEHPSLVAEHHVKAEKHSDHSPLLSTPVLAPDDPLRFPARLARLSAFAEYTAGDWTTLPEERITLLMRDANSFIGDLKSLLKRYPPDEAQLHIVQYIELEALRVIGHVEVVRAVRMAAGVISGQDAPIIGSREILDKQERERLKQAINWMEQAEQILPTPSLYCDLAQAHILIRDLKSAQSYARDAILQDNDANEYAVYLAVESYWLEGTKDSLELAKQYAAKYSAPTLPEFKALRAKVLS